MALFCLDWDYTVTIKHMHWELASKGIERDDQKESADPWALAIAKGIQYTGPVDAWKNEIERLIKKGHHVAITSFSHYPKVIQDYLLTQMRIDPEFASKVFISAGFPIDTAGNEVSQSQFDEYGKSQHIEKAKKHFGIDFLPEEIILIDDTGGSIKRAKEDGHIHSQEVDAADDDPKGGYNNVLTIARAENQLAFQQGVPALIDEINLRRVDNKVSDADLNRLALLISKEEDRDALFKTNGDISVLKSTYDPETKKVTLSLMILR